MSDKQFQWSLTTLSILVILWIVVGSIFVLGAAWTIIIGLIVWIVGGGTLLHYWGKTYMSQL
jgi:hypothetical protein